jgi:hypothetical protein
VSEASADGSQERTERFTSAELELAVGVITASVAALLVAEALLLVITTV